MSDFYDIKKLMNSSTYGVILSPRNAGKNKFMKELATKRSNCLCKIKHFKQFGLPLTERQVKILVLDETYRLQSQYFRVYQIGDPATVQETYDKLCKLLDEELQANAQEDQ